jgi:PAS domain S-box-containing protein
MNGPKTSLIVMERMAAMPERRREDLERRFSPVPGNDFAFLANSIPQLVWSSTRDGQCDYFNQRWFDYTGSTYEQSAGSGWQYVIHADDLSPTVHAWTEANRTGQECVVEHRLRHRSGEYRWNLTKAMPMRSADGTIERWFGTCTDVHEQKQAGLRKRQMAKKLARAKVSTELAHEINNPLNAAMNLLYLAQVFPSESTTFAAQAEEQLKKIATLVANVLDQKFIKL